MFKRIKKLWQKEPYRLGDKIKCPHCGTIMTLFKQKEATNETNTA